jgi:hypothetical protein
LRLLTSAWENDLVAKLLLLSVVFAVIGIPLLFTRERSDRRGLQKVLLAMLAFNLFYLFAVRFIYPRLL